MFKRNFVRRTAAGSTWISQFRYGFEGGPVFGSFSSDANADAEQRRVYCKALVYASCGSRLARDWIAGCASLSLRNADLVTVALQHDGTEEDVVRLKDMLAKRVQQSSGSCTPVSEETGGERAMTTSSGNDSTTVSGGMGGTLSHAFRRPAAGALSPPSLLEEDDALLHALSPLTMKESDTVVRCFLYDAVKAASFHASELVPEQVRHLEHVCQIFGVNEQVEVDPSPPRSEDDNGSSRARDSTESHPSESGGSGITNGNRAHASGGAHPMAEERDELSTTIPFLQATIDIVQEENVIMKEKFRVIEQHGGGVGAA